MFNAKFMIDKCETINCQNGGTCILEEGRAVCECTDEYTGETCEKRKYILTFESFL